MGAEFAIESSIYYDFDQSQHVALDYVEHLLPMGIC
jgi:hypothetical protein